MKNLRYTWKIALFIFQMISLLLQLGVIICLAYVLCCVLPILSFGGSIILIFLAICCYIFARSIRGFVKDTKNIRKEELL